MTVTVPERQEWVNTLYRTVKPVFSALADGQLKATMPVEIAHPRPRDHVTHLEAFGRALAGVAPWLAVSARDPDEVQRQDEVRAWAQQGLRMACDPASPDYMNFTGQSTHADDPRQPLVDVAFMVHGILRALPVLWEGLSAETQGLVIDAVRQCRGIVPYYSNWLLFAAMVETFLHTVGADSDHMRIDVALRQHEAWYVGDGTYGDGPLFHWDYYNSYVIQPMLLDITRSMAGTDPEWDQIAGAIRARARRYALVQERMIAPDGTFPVIGRSICYRNGAFQLLAQIALQDDLPAELAPAQVRGALTAVMRRTLGAPGTYDEAGWLTLGLAGRQPTLAESYISTGSLYLCTVGFLPLGLAPTHEFWTGEDIPWTSQRIWGGADTPADKAAD